MYELDWPVIVLLLINADREDGNLTLENMGIQSGCYRFTRDLLQLSSLGSPSPSMDWARGPSPITMDVLFPYLRMHPDQSFAEYIYNGLEQGFRIGFDPSTHQLRSSGHNHPSSMANPSVIQTHIQDERVAGRLFGPLSPQRAQVVQVSPLGLVPKSNHSDKWRVIVDLSFPMHHSVNDGISSELCSVVYASIDDEVVQIRRLGRGTQLVKLDLRSAYRIIPVHPVDQCRLGITWQGGVYIDRALPFGLRSAPKIFMAVADAMAWVLHCRGIRCLLHYLDDFLLFGAPGTTEATQALQIALTTFNDLHIPVATQKTEGPSPSVTFLGILIDTNAVQLRLPTDKIRRLRNLINTWQGKRSCTRKELESMLGYLSHAASVVRPGRIFLRQLFSLLPLAKKPHHRVRLNSVVRADLRWWACFLQEWNGSFFLCPPRPTIHVYSDASGSYGCGAFIVGGSWFQIQWPSSWSEVEITAKELVPIVVAAAIWGRGWPGQHVSFHSDNMAVVAILNAGSARDHRLTHLLRCLYFYSAGFNFQYTAIHVPGRENVVADAISRNNVNLTCFLPTQACRIEVPWTLMELLLEHTPDWGSQLWTTRFMNSLSRGFPLQRLLPIDQD